MSAKIHIIDDDEAVRDSICVLLESYGYEVHQHASAEDYPKKLARDADLLLVDQHMPGMTGLALLEHLRANGNQTPAIMITGRSDQTIIPRANHMGVKLFNKPLVPELLITEIEQICQPRLKP